MQDAIVLRKAMKGLGTDEQAIFDIAAPHNSYERFIINRCFTAVTGLNRITTISKDFAGNAGILMQQAFNNCYYQWFSYMRNQEAPKTLITAVILMSDHDLPAVNDTLKQLGSSDFYTIFGDRYSEVDYTPTLCMDQQLLKTQLGSQPGS
ncbi:Annexin_9 [Hexamita inflata]|uniref:Annexin 9 n=1 Tax=Hexamita inflata TaxID=28002 RepID=A0AA86PRF5_9EUKA|nr:Annexin 9 [Hexamita inflata]